MIRLSPSFSMRTTSRTFPCTATTSWSSWSRRGRAVYSLRIFHAGQRLTLCLECKHTPIGLCRSQSRRYSGQGGKWPDLVIETKHLHLPFQALNDSYRTLQERYKPLFKSTKGIIFLGTPHHGSDIAGWAVTASKLAKLALQDSNQRVIKGLSPNNELLSHLSEAFLQLVDKGNIGFHTFYETKAMTGVYGITGMVVPYESARIGDIKREVLLGLHANHRDICRFASADDEMYRAVSGAIVDYIAQAATSSGL